MYLVTVHERHGGGRTANLNSALWVCFHCLPRLIGVTLVAVLLGGGLVRATEEQGEVEGGYMLLQSAEGASGRAIVQGSKVHFDISGMVAVVSLEQTFSNPSDRWMEGVYSFPLPETAAVRYLELVIGDRKIVGKVREKAQAKAIYRAAKKTGKKASLIEQQRPNIFTNRVANIGPGELITVRLEYVQQVDYVAGEFSLRFPMTITPRYMPGSPITADHDPEDAESVEVNPYLGWAMATDQVPDAGAISPAQYQRSGSDRSPLNPIEITAQLDMGMPLAKVESSYHQLSLARDKGRYSIELVSGVSEMDRDFVLSWQPVTGSAPTAALFTEQVGDEYFGLMLVVPPTSTKMAAPLPREIIFVVDTSGSMGGVSIAQARKSLALALQRLSSQDRFNIIEFNSIHRALYKQPVSASRHNVQRAQEFVRQLKASGGTEMLPALRRALSPEGDPDLYREQVGLRQVVFITDGAVGNELALFEEIASRLGDTRLFTVGIGSAPNSWFMRKAADFGRGTHTHIGDLTEIGDKMSLLFEQLAEPAALDISISWPVSVEVWPKRVPDLYSGEPVLVAVNFGDKQPVGEVEISGRLSDQQWRKQLKLVAPDGDSQFNQHPGIASLWARQKIAGLLDKKVLGRDEDSVRADVLPVALKHQLMSPYTSFVAVEELISRPTSELLGKKAVANTRPQGQSSQSYAYPRTATNGPAQVYLGTFLLFLAMMFYVMRRAEEDNLRV
ncbi:MAG: Ca-activated chloride channel family protein [Halieaceae bacterium]